MATTPVGNKMVQITIVGCGNMGGALAKCLSEEQIHLYDHRYENALRIQSEGYGNAFRSLQEAIAGSKIIFLAVKPQNLEDISKLLSPLITSDQLLISVLAGINLAKLRDSFSKGMLFRMMPNMAVSIGEGTIAYAADPMLTSEWQNTITRLSSSLGKVYWLEESMIDAFTALAGSGPAFFFAIIESMIKAGVGMGFTHDDSQAIVYQMIKGSYQLLEQTGKRPEELIWQIASPKGTTMAGLQILQEKGVNQCLEETFHAALKRARELGS